MDSFSDGGMSVRAPPLSFSLLGNFVIDNILPCNGHVVNACGEPVEQFILFDNHVGSELIERFILFDNHVGSASSEPAERFIRFENHVGSASSEPIEQFILFDNHVGSPSNNYVEQFILFDNHVGNASYGYVEHLMPSESLFALHSPPLRAAPTACDWVSIWRAVVNKRLYWIASVKKSTHTRDLINTGCTWYSGQTGHVTIRVAMAVGQR
jgi:hypothetical protein